MIRPTVGFIVYGVHKDGLKDPMGTPFIDDVVVGNAQRALSDAGLELVEHDVVVATKEEARAALKKMKLEDQVDAVLLFSGTWVWAAHLAGAIRDSAATGKAVVVWTHPGSQGWRPVGELAMHGGLLEIGVPHKFVCGEAGNSDTIASIVSYAQAAHLKSCLNMATVGAFGGRGMGNTCGVADTSQWMRMFGIDIDSRDTTELIRTAEAISAAELAEFLPRLERLFGTTPEMNTVNERSVRLYLALRKIVRKEKFDFYVLRAFPGLGDDYSAQSFAQSMMLEDGYGTAALGDFNTALTAFLMAKLSKEPVYYGDIQHIDRQKKEIKIIGGACPPSLAGKSGPAGFGRHGLPTESRAGGLSVMLVCEAGEGVLARLGRVNGKFQMAIARASISEPPQDQLQERLEECRIPFWPHAFVTPHCDIETLLQNWTSEYACWGYGAELYPALVDFCELAGISAVLP